MAPTYFFLDTERADAAGAELVSIALVREDGHFFYAERAELFNSPTDFVLKTVYPLLERARAAMPDASLTASLRAFLSQADAPAVMADYPNDLQLLQYALDGFELTNDQATECCPKPAPVMTRMLKEGLMGMLVEDWFAAHPDLSAKRHHALVDAQALRHAWMVATDRLPPQLGPSRTAASGDRLASRQKNPVGHSATTDSLRWHAAPNWTSTNNAQGRRVAQPCMITGFGILSVCSEAADRDGPLVGVHVADVRQ